MIVIPMAGESRRFRVAGYNQPKYMLPLDGRPLFDWTVLSFRRCFRNEEFLLIARDIDGTATFLEQRLRVLGLSRQARVVLLDRITAGQAETVELGLQRSALPMQIPITIFNIDTIRPGYTPPTAPEVAASDGWLEVFQGEGESWSFAEPIAPGSVFVRRTTEKQRISDYCSTGLYGFREASLFLDALAAERDRPSSHELFVAPIYNHLISAGRRVTMDLIESSRVLFSGVPAEYEALVRVRMSELAW